VIALWVAVWVVDAVLPIVMGAFAFVPDEIFTGAVDVPPVLILIVPALAGSVARFNVPPPCPVNKFVSFPDPQLAVKIPVDAKLKEPPRKESCPELLEPPQFNATFVAELPPIITSPVVSAEPILISVVADADTILFVIRFPLMSVFAFENVFSPVTVCVVFNVTKAPVVALSTYAVVAILVELSPGDMVGAVPLVLIVILSTLMLVAVVLSVSILFRPSRVG
jgi:hypothetical protein